MLYTSGDSVTMHEGDFGLPLTIRLTGGEFCQTDKLRFSVLRGSAEVLHKDYAYDDFADGAFILAFTADDSAKLPAGSYLWELALIREDGPQRNTFKGPCLLEVIRRGT